MFYKLFVCLFICVVFDYCFITVQANSLHNRIKRFEEFDEKSSEETLPPNWPNGENQTEECKNWFQSIVEFFFAEPNEARGEPGGVFTRMVNWVKSKMCHINGTCNDGEPPIPSPDFPRKVPAFSPEDEPYPKEPEAEEVPEVKSSDNDVE